MKVTRLAVLAVAAAMFFGMSADFRAPEGAAFDLTMSAVAQEAAPVATSDAPVLAEGAPTTLLDYWKQGGSTMYALLAVAIWATAVALELLLKIRVSVFVPPDLVRQISDAISVADYQKAWKIGADNPSPLTRVFCASIEKVAKGREAVDEAMMEASNNENSIYTIKNSYISLCAAIAPMLGLFGTISGMIGAFNSMAYGGAVGDPTKLAGDIGEALLTTYGGLVIAIPSMVLFYVIANRLRKMMGIVQNALAGIVDQVDFDNLPPDLVVATREMKAMAAAGGGRMSETGKVGKKAAQKPGAPAKKTSQEVKQATASQPAAGGEMVQCPNCNKEIKVGVKACPHCNEEIDWE